LRDFRHVPHRPPRLDPDEQRRRVTAFADHMVLRRTVRHFAPDPVPDGVLDQAIRAAASAPSGAHRQPWRFVVVRDPAIKHQIRVAAEEEERESYERRMPEEWLEALEPFGTDWHKPFLEIAPALIVVFREDYGIAAEEDRRIKNYYVMESVGIACGFLLAALHVAGLATLTHTPSPMGFLGRILNRPPNEKAFVLIPVGYPAPEATVPDITRKPLADVRIEM
jgi:iodotyrosine deiodinase